MAIDFGQQGIRSNVLITGYVQSDHTERHLQESADPEAALQRMVDFLVRTGAHTSYMALLGASPTTILDKTGITI